MRNTFCKSFRIHRDAAVQGSKDRRGEQPAIVNNDNDLMQNTIYSEHEEPRYAAKSCFL